MPQNFNAIHNPDFPDVLLLTWDNPQFITGDVSGYVVFYRPEGGKDWTSKTVPSNIKGYNITDFDLGKNYETYVVAVDKNGQGDTSGIVSLPTLSGM